MLDSDKVIEWDNSPELLTVRFADGAQLQMQKGVDEAGELFYTLCGMHGSRCTQDAAMNALADMAVQHGQSKQWAESWIKQLRFYDASVTAKLREVH